MTEELSLWNLYNFFQLLYPCCVNSCCFSHALIRWNKFSESSFRFQMSISQMIFGILRQLRREEVLAASMWNPGGSFKHSNNGDILV